MGDSTPAAQGVAGPGPVQGPRSQAQTLQDIAQGAGLTNAQRRQINRLANNVPGGANTAQRRAGRRTLLERARDAIRRFRELRNR